MCQCHHHDFMPRVQELLLLLLPHHSMQPGLGQFVGSHATLSPRPACCSQPEDKHKWPSPQAS